MPHGGRSFSGTNDANAKGEGSHDDEAGMNESESKQRAVCVSVSLLSNGFFELPHKEESRRVGLTMEHASAALFYLTRMDG
jgi:hypothetical protein